MLKKYEKKQNIIFNILTCNCSAILFKINYKMKAFNKPEVLKLIIKI